MSSSTQGSERASMASRWTNSPVISRLRNSPVISAARRWAAGKASPKPQPRDPRRFPTNLAPQNSNPQNHQEAQIVQDTIDSSNRVTKFARNASPRLKKMGEGFLEAIKGSWNAMQNPMFRQDFKIFIQNTFSITLGLYALFGVFIILYLPIVLFFSSWSIGLIGQILTLIPLWSFVIARKRTPMIVNRLFLDELQNLSSQRTQELSHQMKGEEFIKNNWIEESYHDLRTSWHFTKYSLMFLTFSIIPIVGSFITFFGQIWLVSDRMGWNLLSVYTISAKKMSYRQQKHWMRARKWRIIGFTLPFTLLSSIPIIGPLFLGLAQAATAHIYFHLLSKDTDMGEKKQNSSPLVEFKKAI